MIATAKPHRFRRYFSHFEVRFLFVTIAVICATFAVVLMLDLFSEGATAAFDRSLILAFRSPADASDAIGPHWVEEMGRDFTALGGFPVLSLLTLAIVGFLVFRCQRAAAAIVLGSTLVALLLSSGLKSAIDRTRPDLVPHGQHVYTASFPSGHSMHAAATYFTLGSLLALFQQRRRLKVFVLSMAALTTVLVGVSRVYLGVHWPTDVLGGWAFGTFCALVTVLLARWLLTIPEVAEEVEKEEGAADESR
jgi:undecaprenyl-diphosphatase